MDGRWLPIDAFMEELDRDDWADRIAARHIQGEQELEADRRARGVPLSDDD